RFVAEPRTISGAEEFDNALVICERERAIESTAPMKLPDPPAAGFPSTKSQLTRRAYRWNVLEIVSPPISQWHRVLLRFATWSIAKASKSEISFFQGLPFVAQRTART